MSENVNVHCYIPLQIKIRAKKEGVKFSEALTKGIRLFVSRKNGTAFDEYE